jgi:putative ABC transport system ATP-binding protein
MITLSNVEKCYESRAGKSWVLRRISLEIRGGEFVTIMGPSGAGKSTLLAIIGMLDGEWQGEYSFLGHEVARLSNKERLALHKQHFGFVFQQYHLIDDLTVAENLDLPLSYRDIPRLERQTSVADALDRFQIVAKKDLFPSQLSGGQQQLVAVARAVIGNPRVILADEPVGSLHSDHGRMIMELLAKLNREGVTVIQVTHSNEWAAYGSRIIKLRDGWLE